MLLAGCAGDRTERFTPPSASARRCVESALAAWREGRPTGPINDANPAIHVVDTLRSPGQKLRDFAVLSETRASGAGWTIVVRLTFENPAVEQRARFVVVGINPIWVFRKEDYDHLAHWEHPTPETPAPAARPAGTSPISASEDSGGET
jgi:hypothetical protein